MKFSGTMASERSRAKPMAQRHAGGTVELAARIGYGAKGLVYGTLGVLAAVTAFGFSGGPRQAQGLAQALRAFADGPYGQIWLGAIGLGFLCYGAYCFTNARFRHIPS